MRRRELKGNPSVIEGKVPTRTYTPGRTKCSRCGETLGSRDGAKPGPGRSWHHGNGCPDHTAYAQEREREGQEASVLSTMNGLQTGSRELWDEYVLFRTYDDRLASTLLLALDRAPTCDGVNYVREGLARSSP